MTPLVCLFLEKSRLTILLMIGLVLIGSFLYLDFPKREDPRIIIRTATVVFVFPGMVPERVEKLIAEPVERKIREIPEVEKIRSLVRPGTLTVFVDLWDSTIDLDPVWEDLRNRMDEVKAQLPEGVRDPFVNTDYGDVTIASIAMTAEGFSFREMEIAAKELQRELYRIKGVAKVSLYGAQQERIWLEFNTESTVVLSGQFDQLIEDLTKQNIVLPAGTLDADDTSLLLEASGDFKSVGEIKNLLTKMVGTENFARLSDLLTVRRGTIAPKQNSIYFNGRPALVIGVEMSDGFDIEAVGEDLKRTVTSLENGLPIGYQLSFATFQPHDVTNVVDGAISNVLQTFALVLVVMMMFLGLGSGLIIASIVPFAILFALIGMALIGISLEQISIAAIIISLGLLVDNGVVIVEDIQSRIESGMPKKEAAFAAGGQYAVPLLVSSLTTIFAFLPFFLLEGNEGEYAFSLGVVVTLSLIGSWLAAMCFLPFLSATLLKARPEAVAVAVADEAINNQPPMQEGWGSRLYTPGLAFAVRLPLPVLVLSYAVVVGAVCLLGQVRDEMFPYAERTEVLIQMEMPMGTNITATEKAAAGVSEWLMNREKNPEIVNHISYVGTGGPRFYLALDPPDDAPEVALTLVNVKNANNVAAFTTRTAAYLRRHHPEARFKLKRLSMGESAPGEVKIEIAGPDLDGLLARAHQVETIFAAVPGITENENDWGDKIIKILIDVNQDTARRLGINSESLSQILSAEFDGLIISEYRENDQSVPIVLRLAEKDRDSLEDLLNITVGGNDTSTIAIEQVAELKPVLEFSQIRRVNQVRQITVTAASVLFTANELIQRIGPELDAIDRSGGYTITIAGEASNSGDVYNKLASSLPITFLMMLVVIIFQFNSFRRTLIVFMTIPLIVIGVPLALILTGEPLAFFGVLGMISLGGIVINNAIVLIDQIDIERADKSVEEAVMAAAKKRLRPILLTSTTTIIGLVPLFLSGGALWSPLAAVMIGGLMVSSLVSLFFVPAAYQLMFRD